MTERELNIALREMARVEGLCDQWYGEWSDDDSIDDCLDRYIRGHDFTISKDWPSLDFIRKNFDIQDLHRHNIYLDEKVDIADADNGYYVFLGNCDAIVWVNGFKATTIFCRHDSHVNVFAADGARVFVRYYDHSDGKCDSDKFSKAIKFDRQKK